MYLFIYNSNSNSYTNPDAYPNLNPNSTTDTKLLVMLKCLDDTAKGKQFVIRYNWLGLPLSHAQKWDIEKATSMDLFKDTSDLF